MTQSSIQQIPKWEKRRILTTELLSAHADSVYISILQHAEQ